MTGQLATPDVSAAAVSLAADDLRRLMGLVDTAMAGVTGPGAAGGWQGVAAEAYGDWLAHVDVLLDTVTAAVAGAVRALDDITSETEATTRQIDDLQFRLDMAEMAMDPTTAAEIHAQAARVLDRHHRVVAQAAAALREITARIPGAPPPICPAAPTDQGVWTDQQIRDLRRGIGDAAWDAGPGTLSALLRWTSVPGLLGAFDRLDEVENHTKVRLDEWGGGRTDTRTNQAAYGTASVAAAFLPGPQGKTGIASWAGRSGARHLARIAGLGWHGDATLHLTPSELAAVNDFLTRAVDVEPRVTALMEAAMRGLPDVHAIGRDHVLKAPASLFRKVAERADVGFFRNTKPVLEKLNDSVRYTFTSAGGILTENANIITARLETAGLKPTKWTPSWGGDGYQGINSTWQDESGHLIEVQFHTPSSAWAKEYTHPAYAIVRLSSTSRRERKEMALFQAEIFSQVSPPAVLERLVNRVKAWS